MEVLVVLKFFLVSLGLFITILSGTLLIRHRKVIAYFKSAFTFIRTDYDPEISEKNQENETIIMIGKILVICGILGIILSFAGTIWMVSQKNMSIDIF